MPHTAALVSGGVDSSVALMRLVEQGVEDATAYYIKIWLEDDLAFLGRCPWQEDLEIVRRVCAAAGVPLEVVSLQREYLEGVVEHTLEELRAGRTPSPDVRCNRRIKFAAFVDRVHPRGTFVATGHHARVRRDPDGIHLLRGADPVKDQSYFLSQLSREQLARCLFPVGDLRKSDVRAMARAWGLPNADRPDSQGICFLGRIPYTEFVRHHLGERPGEIRDLDSGRLLGFHRGYWFHTIGQRRGLGLAGGPWYVVDKVVDENRLWVVHGERLITGARRRFSVTRPHWIAGPPSSSRLRVRLRHGPRSVPCRLHAGDGGTVAVELDEPDAGIAPGQFAVFYDGEECLGGGPVD
jgi:tRNA-specific 2-thiouridylase